MPALVRRALVGLVLVTAAVTPMGFLVWLHSVEDVRLEELDSNPIPVVVYAEEEQLVTQWDAMIELVWTPGPRALSVTGGGMVTAVYASPGETVTSGEPVIAIDGIDRVAVRSPSPFYRSLRRWDRGPDVEALQRFLSNLGLFEGEADGVFRPDLETSVRAWQLDIHVPKPSAVFDPRHTVWLPVEPLTVHEVNAEPAAPPPGLGATLILAVPTLVAAQIEDAALVASLDVAGLYEFRIGTGAIAVDPESGTLEATDLGPLVREVNPGERNAAGVLHRIGAEEVVVIPSASVVVDLSGDLCVFVVDNGDYLPRSVRVAGSRLGRTQVVDGVVAGERVLVNAAEVLGSFACP